MLALDLPDAPYWIGLPHGVRAEIRPVTTAVMAAAQAFTLCVIGAVLGVAVGVVPGIALAYPLTAQSFNPLTGESVTGDPILVFPWLVLVGFAIAVPAVSAGLAAAGIRKAPDATHRTA